MLAQARNTSQPRARAISGYWFKLNMRLPACALQFLLSFLHNGKWKLEVENGKWNVRSGLPYRNDGHSPTSWMGAPACACSAWGLHVYGWLELMRRLLYTCIDHAGSIVKY